MRKHRTDFPVEFGCVNPKYRKHECQYAYGLSISIDARYRTNQIWNTIVKADLNSKQRTEWCEEYCFPSHPVFVSSPHHEGNDAEHEGIVLSVVLDSKFDRSFLLFLDANTMREIARVDMPHAVPFALHGDFAYEVRSVYRAFIRS
jgi:carotenoid cleavage dioxygenase-like enzyme